MKLSGYIRNTGDISHLFLDADEIHPQSMIVTCTAGDLTKVSIAYGLEPDDTIYLDGYLVDREEYDMFKRWQDDGRVGKIVELADNLQAIVAAYESASEVVYGFREDMIKARVELREHLKEPDFKKYFYENQ
jgi:hypothetical protein